MSDLARDLIGQNKRTKATYLDLGNCGLTALPEELRELVWLEYVSLASSWSVWNGEQWERRNSRNTAAPNTRLHDIAALAGLDRLRELVLTNTAVADLTPLARLTALRTVDATDTHIADLTPLARLTALQTLGLTRTQVADLTPLASLTALQSLDVTSTQVADLAPLAGLTALQRLTITRTRVTDLTPLAGLTGLQTFTASDTPVADLTPLTGLTGLQKLTVTDTAVADLTPLAGLTALQALTISGTQVTDATPLAGLTTLQRLTLTRTQVANLTPLAGLRALQTLTVSDTPVADLTPVSGLTTLQRLTITRTQVANLTPLAGLAGLQTLIVTDTPVADLMPLARLTALQKLIVTSTQVADLTPLADLTALQTLDVSRTQVRDLTPLASLAALQTLTATDTAVADLTRLAGLATLQTLDVSRTPVTSLAPLAGLTALQTLIVPSTRITDLTPLAGLTALQKLNVTSTQVADLAPLAGLGALQTLLVAGTPVTDLTPLAGLTALQTLDVSRTPVRDLAPLAGLITLQTLLGARAPVTDLTPLAGLTALQTLDVSRTQVADLSGIQALIIRGCPVRWATWPGPAGIFVKECPLISPPPAIAQQGNNAILNYFHERQASGVDHLYEAKLLILGEGGSGKSTLLRRLFRPDLPMPGERDTTKGIDIYRHDFMLKNGRRFRLNVWDFAGQEIYHATHHFFLTRRSLYLLLDDTRKDHKSVSDEGFKYWLELIDLFGGHSPVLIFQNEKGGRSKTIDLAGIKGRYDNVKERYAGNLEHSDAAAAARDGVEFYASQMSHIGEELPSRWVAIRADIECLASEKAHISLRQYLAIYDRHLQPDRARALHLSRYLHDLGVFLHFQDEPLLNRTVILQNQWATEAVFKVLDDERVKRAFGRFTSADCERLWDDSAYADMHLELLALMQLFELCYALPDRQPVTWLAPQLLRPAKPDALTNREPSTGPELVLRYRYDFLPKGTISRLTVRLHRFVKDPEMAWTTGVLFERDETSVLVEVLANGHELELRACGPQHKELLSVISADLDALNDSFQGLSDRVHKRIPCHCTLCRVAATPEFFDHNNLTRRVAYRRLRIECPRSFEEVGVLELLDGIRLDALPDWAHVDPHKAAPRVVRIFIASSSELHEDRQEFELYVRQRNDYFSKQGIYLKIVRWETFFDAMSETRLQDEYNKAIRACDVFVSLFFTKTGRFTEEEFDVAHDQFASAGRPLIYTFFKNAEITTGTATARRDDLMSLWAFKDRLHTMGHFPTSYDNIDQLKHKFRDQLDELLDALLDSDARERRIGSAHPPQ